MHGHVASVLFGVSVQEFGDCLQRCRGFLTIDSPSFGTVQGDDGV